MTRPSFDSEPQRRMSGASVLICVPRTGSRALTQRLRALLAGHVDSVAVSDGSQESTSPALSLLVHGWGTLEPLAALRECQLKFATSAIVVVNQRSGSMILELLRAGATDCVRWPAPSADAELLARVEGRLKCAPENVALDATSLTLTCGDVIARLTLLEFRIVHHLLQNAARWSTTEEMTIAALRSGHASESVLRVRIYAIRRKLKQQSWRLRSNRTFGYRFDIRASQTDRIDDNSHSVA